MRHIDAASVAEELLKLFSRVGVPKEILTDQGTNFTSQLLVLNYTRCYMFSRFGPQAIIHRWTVRQNVLIEP